MMRLFYLQRYIALAAILLALLFVVGCLEDPLVDEWAVVNDNGIQGTSMAKVFKFHPDRTLTIYENNPVGGTIAYQIDSARDPIWIDWNGALGIMRFVDDNTIEIGFNKERSIPSNYFGQGGIEKAIRPVSFEKSDFHFILRRLAQGE